MLHTNGYKKPILIFINIVLIVNDRSNLFDFNNNYRPIFSNLHLVLLEIINVTLTKNYYPQIYNVLLQNRIYNIRIYNNRYYFSLFR